MRLDMMIRPALLVVFAGSIAACSDATTTAPLLAASNLAANDRTAPTAPTTRPTPPRRGGLASPDTAVRHTCRSDDGLTQQQIEEIRALFNAYLDEIADDLRLIAQVEQDARAAAQRGASPEQIAAILARADGAKQHIADATQRLRTDIQKITHDDRLPCSITLPVATG